MNELTLSRSRGPLESLKSLGASPSSSGMLRQMTPSTDRAADQIKPVTKMTLRSMLGAAHCGAGGHCHQTALLRLLS